MSEVEELSALLEHMGCTKISTTEDDRGEKITCCCPWHEDNSPSFMLRPGSHIYNCWACGAGPDLGYKTTSGLVSLVRKWSIAQTGKDLPSKKAFAVAAQFVSMPNLKRRKVKAHTEEYNLRPIPMSHLSAYYPAQEAYDYMTGRNFTVEACDHFRVGFDVTRQRAVFPIFDQDEQLLTFVGRTTFSAAKLKAINAKREAEGKGKYPKYIIYNKAPRGYLLGNAQVLSSITDDHIIVVESMMDLLAVFSFGFTNVVSILGSHVSKWQWEQIRKFKHIHLFLDNDPAGYSGMEALCEIAKSTNNIVYLPRYDEHDPDMDEMTLSRFKFLYKNPFRKSRFISRLPRAV